MNLDAAFGSSQIRKSSNVFPTLFETNTANRCLTYAIFFGKRRLLFPFFAALAYLAHLIIREFCLVVGFSESGGSACSTFRLTISHIIKLISQEQMCGIDARRIITAMADEYTIRDGAIVDFPGKTMRVDSYFAKKCRCPIPVIIDWVIPKPTLVNGTWSNV